MAVAIPFLLAASAAVSAYSAIQQGKAAKAAEDYNSTIANQNAQIAQQQTKVADQQQARENYLRLGAIRAAAGANGNANAGSVLDVIGDVAQQGELQRQQIRLGGQLKVRDYTNTAALDSAAGRQAQTSSYFKAGSDLLGGAAGAYSNSLLKRA